jgi:hypothetical protein
MRKVLEAIIAGANNRVRRPSTTVCVAVALAVMSPNLLAQWPRHSAGSFPRTPDGKPDLNAPAPRTSDGKPDLSGVWETVPCISCAPPDISGLGPAPTQGRGASAPAGPAPAGTPPAGAPAAGLAGPGRFVFGNVGAGQPDGAPYQPWAAELVKKRMAANSKDNPDAHCLPMGIMQLTSHPYPRKIIQTPTEVVIIYEGSGTTVREVFLDGRPLPDKDAEPWWNGYSVGRWEGDTLVVETSGFMDDGWLDVRGSPLTSAGKLTERFRRVNFGYLENAVTIDDPKAYTKPFTATVYYRIAVDTQLIEFVCLDKDAAHYVGGSGK